MTTSLPTCDSPNPSDAVVVLDGDASFTARETLRCCVEAFDGPPGIAQLARSEFNEAKVGSQLRQRMLLALITASLKFGDDQEDEGSIEEMEAEVDRRILLQVGAAE